MMNLETIKHTIRDVPDFPKPGIIFKDITPILKNPEMVKFIVEHIKNQFVHHEIDVVAGVESRGFLFGMLLAQALGKPFVPVRKAGKLPFKTLSKTYDLEYGTATIEMHTDAFEKGQKVLLHDDLLATGGTVLASAELIEQLGAELAGFSFLISLDFLEGKEKLKIFQKPIDSVLSY